MLEGLLAAHRRYDELSAQLSQPDAASDIGRYRALMKEYKELEPLSRQYLALAAAEEALAEAKELLYSHDAELSAMAAEQKAEAEEEITRLTEEARLMLLPHDPNDGKNVILEIRPGVGGEESALFAHSHYGAACRHRRGGGRSFCGRPVPHVQSVCGGPRLAGGADERG